MHGAVIVKLGGSYAASGERTHWLDAIERCAGKMILVKRTAQTLPRSFTGFFTVDAKVVKGQLLSGAQLVNKGTNDPAFVLGTTEH